MRRGGERGEKEGQKKNNNNWAQVQCFAAPVSTLHIDWGFYKYLDFR